MNLHISRGFFETAQAVIIKNLPVLAENTPLDFRYIFLLPAEEEQPIGTGNYEAKRK